MFWIGLHFRWFYSQLGLNLSFFPWKYIIMDTNYLQFWVDHRKTLAPTRAPPPPGPQAQVHQPLFRAKFDRIHWCPQGFLDTPRPQLHPWWKTRTSFVVARTVFFFFLLAISAQHPHSTPGGRRGLFFLFACQLSAAPPVQKSFPGTWGFVSNTGRRDSRVFLCSKGRLGQKSTRFWKLHCLTKIQTPYPKLMIMVSFYWKINVLPNKK